MHNFSATLDFDAPTCANCATQAQEGALSTALVPITMPLYSLALDSDFNGFNAITPAETEKFLAAALTWKATDVS